MQYVYKACLQCKRGPVQGFKTNDKTDTLNPNVHDQWKFRDSLRIRNIVVLSKAGGIDGACKNIFIG